MCGCNKNTVQEPVFSYFHQLLKESHRYTIWEKDWNRVQSFSLGSVQRQLFQGVSAHLVSALVPRVFIWQMALEDKDSVSLQGKHWPGLYTVHYIILGALYSVYNSTEHPLCHSSCLSCSSSCRGAWGVQRRQEGQPKQPGNKPSVEPWIIRSFVSKKRPHVFCQRPRSGSMLPC